MDLQLDLVLEHAWISLAGWLLGLATGAGLGYGGARLLRSLRHARPKAYRWLTLLPWRTVVVALVSPIYITTTVSVFLRLFSFGFETAILGVATAILLLALPLSITLFLESWHPSPIPLRLVAATRTLATVSVAFAAGLGNAAMRGLGETILFSFYWEWYEVLLQHLLAYAGLMLLFDLVLGLVHFYAIGRLEGDGVGDGLDQKPDGLLGGSQRAG